MKFSKPVLLNPTRPRAGDDIAFVDADEFSLRMGQNTGNMAFLHALMSLVDGIEHVSQRPFHEADVKVWGCSNFISSRRDMKVDDSPRYTDGKPLVAIGLGAQASSLSDELPIPQNTQDWISAIGSMAPSAAPNISLRGEFTYGVLKRAGLHERCEVLGCPSLFLNPSRDLGARIRVKLATPVQFVGIAPGNIGNVPPKHLGLERHLTKLVALHQGSYLVQHPPEIFQLVLNSSSGVNLQSATKIRDFICPDMSVSEFLRWLRLHAKIFDSVPSWLLHLRSLDLVISARIHGAQLALQAGTPALCIALDARQLELCQTMHVPHIEREKLGEDFTIADVQARLLDIDWRGFDANRLALAARFSKFLVGNGLTPSRRLDRLAANSSDEPPHRSEAKC